MARTARLASVAVAGPRAGAGSLAWDRLALVAVCAIVACVALAWSRRFVQDDAFISYRYARNLVEGNGLVFNPGEHVEGYTNFLWTLLMAAGLRLGVPIIMWSQVLGMLCFAASLTLTYRLARRLLRSSGWALLAVVLVGLHYSFSAYATGGLETALQTTCVLLAIDVAGNALGRERLRGRDLACFSTVAAAALMTRLDSVLLLAAPAVALGWRLGRTPAAGTAAPRRAVLALVLPGAAALGTWFLWKASFYGSLLPLPFYVKTGGPFATTAQQGAWFFADYLKSYWAIPQVLLVLYFTPRLWRATEMRWLCASCLLWCAYVLWIGGDFMEFRLLVPPLPLWTICVLWGPARCLLRRGATLATAGALAALGLAGSWHHQRTFAYTHGIESVQNLQMHLSVQGWDRIGERLARAFHGRTDGVTIAVTAAGAIPYYSRLRTVDMLGLCDPWIALHGLHFKTQPGHERTAPFQYLVEREVSLVIGHPLVVPATWQLDLGRGFDLRNFRLFDARLADLPPLSRLVEIPIDGHSKLLVLYLVPNENVEAAIREQGWRTVGVGVTPAGR